jgi:inosine-uridine nucleoside N-ribohydrolase
LTLRSLVALAALAIVSSGGAVPARGAEDGRPRQIILDADPGIDDAMAILFALRSPALEVLAITTVFGNADIEVATANALRLVELAGRRVPVARGAAHPLVLPRAKPPDFVHGTDGLGNIGAPPPRTAAVEASGAELILATVRRHPGQVTLVAVGRLTNLALALALEPRLPELVKEVVLMGGSAWAGGNVTPLAEANIWGDPHAADIVFGAPWRVTMVGLDVTTRVRLDDERLLRMARRDERVGGFLFRISRFYKQFHDATGVTGGFYVHDPSAVAYAIDPSLFSTESAAVRVVTEGIGVGQTVAVAGPPAERWEASRGRPAVTICRDVDGERLLRLFEATISPDQSRGHDPSE